MSGPRKRREWVGLKAIKSPNWIRKAPFKVHPKIRLPVVACLVTCPPVRMRRLILLLAGVFCTAAAFAQFEDNTRHRFDRLMERAVDESWQELPMGEIMRETGLFFMDSPYAAGMLDKSVEESLVVDLMQFDCVLYVEAVLALAAGIALEDFSYDGFEDRLEATRYRQGHRDGYCSRLHYFSEWIRDNDYRGIVRAISHDIGGVPLEKTLNFMSSHRSSYPRLLASDSLFSGILDIEASLADMQLYHIPQDNISQVYPMLQDGDILAFSTHIEGLDVTHTGLAFAQPDGQFGLLHASPDGGVMISDDLHDYVAGNRTQIGIMVARPTDPRHSGR